MHSKPAIPSRRPPAAVALISLSVALLLLSLFQWIELVVVRGGGTTVCAINSTINCEKVWDSPFAVRVHQLTHVPVAGWGTVYALTALMLSVAFAVRRRQVRPEGVLMAGLQWTALAGMVSCLVFAFASARVGALCLTCLTTYVLTFGFAAAAFLMLPNQLVPPMPSALDGLLMAAGLTVVGFLVVLYPGQRTPHPQQGSALSGVASSTATQGPITLETLIPRLSPEDLQSLSDATAEYKRSAPPVPPPPTRLLNGPATAPIQVVEFTDILCPHCRHFTESLEQVREIAPPGAIAVQPRHYPLDHECNPFVARSDGTGTHCLAARALICLETSPTYAKVSASLFAHQGELNVDRARQLIAAEGVDLAALDACIALPATAAKLLDDEQYAQAMHIRGTPLVLVNGREAYPAPVFLYAMVLAGGNIDRIAALPLPPPTPRP